MMNVNVKRYAGQRQEMITRNELEQLKQEIILQWQVSLGLATELWNRNGTANSIGTARASHPHIEHVPQVIVLGSGYEATNLCSTLRTHGVEAHPVSSLEEAASLTKVEGVRLAVVDESFFESSSVGWKLRQDRIIPIILLGNDRDREGWEKAFALEADAFLSKSMSQAEQIARIKAVLRRSEPEKEMAR